MEAPCLNCKDRHPGCHDRCETYQKYRKQKDEANERKRMEGAIDGYQIAQMRKSVKKRRKH